MIKISPKQHFKLYGPLKCLDCGQFIADKDLIEGRASHRMVTPDAYATSEEWDTLCHKCLKKEGEVPKSMKQLLTKDDIKKIKEGYALQTLDKELILNTLDHLIHTLNSIGYGDPWRDLPSIATNALASMDYTEDIEE